MLLIVIVEFVVFGVYVFYFGGLGEMDYYVLNVMLNLYDVDGKI